MNVRFEQYTGEQNIALEAFKLATRAVKGTEDRIEITYSAEYEYYEVTGEVDHKKAVKLFNYFEENEFKDVGLTDIISIANLGSWMRNSVPDCFG